MQEKEPVIGLDQIDFEQLNTMEPSEIDAIVEEIDKDPDLDIADEDENPEELTDAEESVEALGTETHGMRISETYKDYHYVNPVDSGQTLFVHKSAVIGENFQTGNTTPSIGREVVIGNDCVIKSEFVGRQVTLGDRVIFGKGSKLGAESKAKGWEKPGVTIGSDVVAHEGVAIRPNSELGDQIIICEGTIIGYQPPTESTPRREKKGNTESARPTKVGSNCFIGRRVKIEAGAQIGSGYSIPNETYIPRSLNIGDSEAPALTILDDREVLRRLGKHAPRTLRR